MDYIKSMRSQSGFAQILVVVLFLVGITSLGLYYVSARQRGPVLSLPTQSPILSPTSTPDPTANWKTYTSKTYGFSFKYPPYFVHLNEDIMKDVYLAPSAGSGESQNSPQGLPPGSIWLWAGGVQTNENTSFNAFFNLEGVKNYYTGSTHEQVSIDNFPGYKISQLNPQGPVKVFSYEGVVFKSNDKVYKITLSSYEIGVTKQNEIVFDQILSTFKFTK